MADTESKPQATADERLIGMMELLVSRLDNMEMKMDALHTKLETQNKVLRHADSLRPLGEVFSGVALTGHAVDLTVHAKFDAEGRFDCGYSSGGMLMLVRKRNPSYEDHEVWTSARYSEKYQRPWEQHVIDAWGLSKYQQVCCTLMTHYRDVQESRSKKLPPTCKDLGVKSGGFEHIQPEMFETAMRYQVPGLLAISGDYVATKLLPIEGAVTLMKKLMLETKQKDQVTEMEIHYIHPDLCQLALAIVHDFGEKEAYNQVQISTNGRAKQILTTHPFFTERMLAGCF